MRILLISPHFPPERGGVSDHSLRFSLQAAELGHQVTVLTQTQGAAAPAGIAIKVTPKDDLRSLFQAAASENFDVCLAQFTPLSFARSSYGIAPQLPRLLRALKRKSKKPLCLFAHESHFPVQASALGVLVGIPHFLQFYALAQIPDLIFFSHQMPVDYWARRIPWKKARFATMPVFSNIPLLEKSSSAREKFSIPADRRVLLYFGGAHDTNLLGHVMAAYEEASKSQPCTLVMAGASREAIASKAPLKEDPNILFAGYLPEQDLSSLYQEADLVLAPFAEGINTRRGSAMAALEHGKAILSTRGWCTQSDHPWNRFMKLTEAADQFAYAKAASQLLQNAGERAELGAAAQAYYQQHFSARVLSASMIEKMESFL